MYQFEISVPITGYQLYTVPAEDAEEALQMVKGDSCGYDDWDIDDILFSEAEILSKSYIPVMGEEGYIDPNQLYLFEG